MGIAAKLITRGITLLGVLIAVLLLLVATLGATGLSDKMLNAIVGEELRSLRQSLAQTIRDPNQLEKILKERKEQLIQSYGLDKPWYFRLPNMVLRVLTLDLGSSRTLRSFSGSQKVSDIVLERLPYTIALVTTSTIITAFLGLYIGVKVATRVGSKLDRAVSYLAATSYALPSWWAGILFILILAFQFRVFPSGGLYGTPPPPDLLGKIFDVFWHACLPIITLVAVSLGSWAYVVRTMVINTAQEDFVSVARAKGLPEKIVMKKYIIRVAAPPILTNIILGLAGSLGGAILTETVFNWPGMGRLYYDAVMSLDENIIVALTFLFTLIYIVARFILEVLYLILDPRVRY